MRISVLITIIAFLPPSLFISACSHNTSCHNSRRTELGYGVIAERDSEEHGEQIGILYGDSLISAPYYSRIEFPDSIKSIVFPYKIYDSKHFDSYGYAILDLKNKKYVYEESAYFPIDTIISIDKLNYALYDDCGRHFTTLKLTETGDEEYHVEFVPFFSQAAMPVTDFIRIGEMESEKPKDGYMKVISDHNPSAYRLLDYIFNMWGVEGSPANDLNFARAMRYFIAKDYNGNESAALSDLDSIIKILESGNTDDMTLSKSIEVYVANMQLSWEYERMMMDYPLYEAEYVAWHNLVEAINHYKDFLFVNTDWYQCKRIDNEETTMNLFIERKDQLKKERNILNGKNHVNVRDNLKTLADIDSILGQYHSPEAPYYYHPMWYEIKPSINQWLLSREMIASTLAPDKAKAFRKLDRELIDCLYYHIELLDYWELRPCFPDERDMSRL